MDFYGRHRFQQQILSIKCTEAHKNCTLLSCHKPLSVLWYQQESLPMHRTPLEGEQTKGLTLKHSAVCMKQNALHKVTRGIYSTNDIPAGGPSSPGATKDVAINPLLPILSCKIQACISQGS